MKHLEKKHVKGEFVVLRINKKFYIVLFGPDGGPSKSSY